MINLIVRFCLNIFYSIFFRVRVEGKENVPKEGAYVIAPKHISNWDPPLLAGKLRRKDVYIMAKKELFVNNFVKLAAKKTLVIPVDRSGHDTAVIKESVKILKKGHPLLMFPEGTRNGIEKHNKIHKGAIVIANMAKVPIVPIGIRATYKPFSKITIVYGKPIDLSQRRLEKEEIDEVTEKLKDDIIMLTNGEK